MMLSIYPIKITIMPSLNFYLLHCIYDFADYATFHSDLIPFFTSDPEIAPQYINDFFDFATGFLMSNAIIKE